MTESEWLTSTNPQRMLRIFWSGVPREASTFRISDRKLRLFAVACCRRVWPLLVDDVPCPYCKDADFSTGDLGTPTMGGEEPYASRAKANWRSKCACSGTGRFNRSRRAVLVAERYADGETSDDELSEGLRLALNAQETIWNHDNYDKAEWGASLFAVMACNGQDPVYGYDRHNYQHMVYAVSRSMQADLLRDIIGNPFRPVELLEPKDTEKMLRLRKLWHEAGRPKDLSLFCDSQKVRELAGFPHWLTPTVLSLAQAAYDERQSQKCERCKDSMLGVGKRHLCESQLDSTCPDCHGSGLIDNGHLDPVRLGILADALEEAGCDDEEVLSHLRGKPCPYCKDVSVSAEDYDRRFAGTRLGREITESMRRAARMECVCKGTGRIPSCPHVRGCWVLDLILRKG
jgi:hypothetical protein